MTNSFFDVLGIVTAFLTVILLLSLIVTALVQMTQAGFGTRGRNLRFGLREVLKAVRENKDVDASLENAGKVLDVTPAALLTRKTQGTGWLGRIMGPGVSWVEPDELEDTLESGALESLQLNEEQKQEVKKRFEQLQRPMEKRLARGMRILTVGFGVLVAFVFQVSTPKLISQLSADPQLRASVLVAADANVQQVEKALVRLEAYSDVAAQALEELEAQYSGEIEALVEEASGVGSTKEEIVAELGSVLEGSDHREEILAAYDARLDALVGESQQAAVEEATQAMQNLALLGIEPWSDPGFYLREGAVQWENLAGVTLTAVLLSFGAPFWFGVLKDVAGLRDALKKTKNGNKEEEPRARS